MLTSVDKEGTGSGYDIKLTRMVADAVSIPVIACGGAGSIEHIGQVIAEGKADAVALASVLHYDFIENNRVEINRENEGNVEFLASRKTFSKIKPANLHDIKDYLHKNGFQCRGSINQEMAGEHTA